MEVCQIAWRVLNRKKAEEYRCQENFEREEGNQDSFDYFSPFFRWSYNTSPTAMGGMRYWCMSDKQVTSDQLPCCCCIGYSRLTYLWRRNSALCSCIGISKLSDKQQLWFFHKIVASSTVHCGMLPYSKDWFYISVSLSAMTLPILSPPPTSTVFLVHKPQCVMSLTDCLDD